MKKIILTFFILCSLMISGFAANLEGNADASASSLKELGLFLGTDKGFELERPMTRVEAATMLVRFFGAEKKALAGNFEHPFTDVPQWADNYVGWLYQSGLTKGISATLYGSKQPITAWQYGMLITRAIREFEEIPHELITEDEIAAIDQNKAFIRGDAAIMSIRALGCYYMKNENYRPLADVCIERGLFTAADFGSACFDFFGPTYSIDRDGFITLRILGIPIRKTLDSGYFTFETIDHIASDGTKFDPFVYREENGTVIIYSMDPLTLETTELARREGISGHYNYRNPFKLGGTHYIFESLADEDKTVLLAVKGNTVTEVLSFINGGENAWYPYDGDTVFIDNESVLIVTKNQYYRVTEDSFSEIQAQNLRSMAYLDGNILAKRINDTSIDVVLLDVKTGNEKACYNVPDDMQRDYYGGGYRDLDRKREGYYYGEAGLYYYDKGTLSQITARPTNSFIKMEDGSYVILTHELGKRYTGMIAFGGNQVMQVFSNGDAKLLTPENMQIDSIDGVLLKDGKVHFVTAQGVGMMHFDRYTYRIEENGKLTVTDFEAGRPEVMDGFSWENPNGYKERYIKKEQERIDVLGY
ncbi:MAG: S-layer homology domain-containing protein [Oscillospiraceae bacterium]|nr:S-layer homology domain-containing protein [Oscillospiraceae bacterium]